MRNLFAVNPHDIYYEIYTLCKYGLTPQYVENISPGERKVFMSYVNMDRNMEQYNRNKEEIEGLGLSYDDFF